MSERIQKFVGELDRSENTAFRTEQQHAQLAVALQLKGFLSRISSISTQASGDYFTNRIKLTSDLLIHRFMLLYYNQLQSETRPRDTAYHCTQASSVPACLTTTRTRLSTNSYGKSLGLTNHTRRDVLLDDFLKDVLFFDVSEWGPKIQEWDFHETDDYQKLQAKYIKECPTEISRYPIFRDWVMMIVNKAIEKFPDHFTNVNLDLHVLGSAAPKDVFGCRKPDIAAAPRGIEISDLQWHHPFFVFEFKKMYRKKRKSPAVPKEQEDDDVFLETGSKRKCNSWLKSDGKKTKVSSAEKKGVSTGSWARKTSNSKKQGLASKKTSNTGSKGSADRFPVNVALGHNPHITDEEEETENVEDEEEEGLTLSLDQMEPMDAPYSRMADVQLANYAVQLLCAKEFREWVVSILVEENGLTLWYYDRAAAFHSVRVQFKSEPISFIKVILALAHCSMDRKRFGFDHIFKGSAEVCPGTADPDGCLYLDASRFTRNDTERDLEQPENNGIPNINLGPNVQIRINKDLHTQFTLFGRATRVHDITIGRFTNNSFESISEGSDLVLKMSYQVATRTPEPTFIQEARKADRVHTPAMLGHIILHTDLLPGTILEGKEHTKPRSDAYEKRNLVLLIMRRYSHAYNLKRKNFLKVYRQLVVCHRRLYLHARILHRDLSLENFMCYKTASGWMALLNDFDLSAFVRDGASQYATNKHRTGTAPYMARELLSKAPEGVALAHVYAHELESLFYLFLFITLGYKKYAPDHDVLKAWRSRNWQQIADEKEFFFLSEKRLEDILGHVTKEHKVSKKFVHGAASLLAHAAAKAHKEMRANANAKLNFNFNFDVDIDISADEDEEDEDDDDDDASPNKSWTLEHSVFEEIVTYRNYGRMIGVSVKDITALKEVKLQLGAQEA